VIGLVHVYNQERFDKVVCSFVLVQS
jgi:hypothetical protein